MASGAIIYVPPSGGTIQAGPGFLPSSIPQQAGTVPYVQNGGQQPGGSSNPPPQNRPTALEKFLQAETKTLGAIQILIGLMHIGFGAVSLAATRNSDFIPLAAIGGYPFWGGVFFIVSGSLSVAAEKNPVFGLVRCCVGFNITSALIAAAGIMLYIVEVLEHHGRSVMTLDQSNLSLQANLLIGISVLLLLFNVLEFCITVSSAHFGCQAFCCNTNPGCLIRMEGLVDRQRSGRLA
ncbi:membrane-spanning 4-domains subfamily A member 8-like isoform X2 [Varanus komodoensis]|uniref:membrane-spanning 4-domains subfamily A member 8-like isoform X2 n=1 Tax=Varanus komodoensis TaxID=61221 RepID=UPI001CF7BD7A|nr:membrane-spanning 4-domains subfamily A member 8-like isoform X2 [Varanus komodoensis]